MFCAPQPVFSKVVIPTREFWKLLSERKPAATVASAWLGGRSDAHGVGVSGRAAMGWAAESRYLFDTFGFAVLRRALVPEAPPEQGLKRAHIGNCGKLVKLLPMFAKSLNHQ